MTARTSFVVLAGGSERGADYRVVVANKHHSEAGLFQVLGTIESRNTPDSSGDSAAKGPDAEKVVTVSFFVLTIMQLPNKAKTALTDGHLVTQFFSAHAGVIRVKEGRCTPDILEAYLDFVTVQTGRSSRAE